MSKQIFIHPIDTKRMYCFFSAQQRELLVGMGGRWLDQSYGYDSHGNPCILTRVRPPYEPRWCRTDDGAVREYTMCSTHPTHRTGWKDVVELGLCELLDAKPAEEAGGST